jgi:hypothetical protein
MTIVWELAAPAEFDLDDPPLVDTLELLPQQRPPSHASVPPQALDLLRHISDRYTGCRARANALRSQGPYDDPVTERGRRDGLVRALQRLHALRDQRSAVLDAYDLPSSAGTSRR